MKIKTLLPVALMAMLISPAFAATATPATSELQISVPEYMSIKKVEGESSGTKLATEASCGSEYSTLSLNEDLVAKFKVTTNMRSTAVSLTATALTGDAGVSTSALGGDAGSPIIVFTNNDSKPDDTAVTNITTGTSTDVTSNPNAIAFNLVPVCTPNSSGAAAGSTVDTPTIANGGLKYKLKNGIYDVTCTISGQALANTFSTHDTNGVYKATLTLSQVTP